MKRPVKKDLFRFLSEDNVKIQCYNWFYPSRNSDSVCMIVHGMADHAQRYEDFANFLAKNNVPVYALDLRGHGHTVKSPQHFGHLSDEDGWFKTLRDIKKFISIIKRKHKNKKIFVYSHSIGEMLIRDLICNDGESIDGAILSGIAANPGIILYVEKITADILVSLKGKRYKTVFLTNLLFGKYNKAFRPNRTAFDWISSIDKEVDRYILDPFCRIIFTAAFFKDLSEGFSRITDYNNIKNTRKDLPIYILSGKDDIVGNSSKGTFQLFNTYKNIGLSDVSYKLYDGARHEIINDISSKEVYQDVLGWIKKYR